MKYNSTKFFVAFFLGKISITIIGAYLGNWSEGALSSVISQEGLIVISIILTIVVTIILLKVAVCKIAEKILKRKITLPQ